MSDLYTEGYDDGGRGKMRDLQPLFDAAFDAVFMFKDIEKARELPAFGNVQAQYVAMGLQLERLLKAYGIERSK